MPDLGVEFHLGRLERVIWRNLYVHVEDASLVACVLLKLRLVVCQRIFPDRETWLIDSSAAKLADELPAESFPLELYLQVQRSCPSSVSGRRP